MAMRVSLFATCLCDQFYAEACADAVLLLRHLGVDVDVPRGQTCCGQPAYNAGRPAEARDMAAHTMHVFEDAEYVVLPSGSCAGMVRRHSVYQGSRVSAKNHDVMIFRPNKNPDLTRASRPGEKKVLTRRGRGSRPAQGSSMDSFFAGRPKIRPRAGFFALRKNNPSKARAKNPVTTSPAPWYSVISTVLCVLDVLYVLHGTPRYSMALHSTPGTRRAPRIPQTPRYSRALCNLYVLLRTPMHS